MCKPFANQPILLPLALLLLVQTSIAQKSLTDFQLDSIYGQPAESQLMLDAYLRQTNLTRKVIPYAPLREADVMWSKRVWENIDLRQKINHPLYFPIISTQERISLFEVIKIGLMREQSLTAYGLGPTQDSDEFLYPLSRSEVHELINPSITRSYEELLTGEKRDTTITAPIQAVDVIAYKLKEDWIFDKQRSQLYVRIIGIAPVVLKYAENGEVKGQKELFWLYYPECRYTFNNYDVFNAHNSAQRMTFDQLFQTRFFQGVIVKEANVYNRRIDEYAKGIDALMEGERVKNDLFVMEHDLWTF